MIFKIISIVVPLLIYFGLPKFLTYFGYKNSNKKAALFVACFLFLISWYLPSPLIDGRDTAFTTHFIGGGLFCGLLWLYLKDNLEINLSPFWEVVSLYFLVSGLGVANELFEWFTVQVHLSDLNPSDTWWDLVANTTGALLFWVIYYLSCKIKNSTTGKIR